MAIETLFGIFATILIVVVVTLAIRTNSAVTSVIYANARLAARTNFLLDSKRMHKLVMAENMPQFINELRDTEHYSYMETVETDDLFEFNVALEKSRVHSYIELKRILPRRYGAITDVFIRRYEAKIIKTYFRSRFSQVGLDKRIVEPMALLDPMLLQHLDNTKTVADMAIVLRDSPYRELFSKNFSSVEEFDQEIENTVLKIIRFVLQGMKLSERTAVSQIFEERSKMRAISMLLKIKLRKIVPTNTLIESMNLDKSTVDRAISAVSLEEFVDVFKGEDLYEELKNGLLNYNQTKTFYSFERNLWRWFFDKVADKDTGNILGLYPVVSYFLRKEREQRNLLIIAKGISSKAQKEKIEEMLI